VVWKGINDGDEDINALVDFCKISPCKVNLIEYNPIGDGQFLKADKDRIQAYESALEAERITVTVRRSRGKDIDAACGQLANKAEGE
jgi:23S rRNA (adenine2503-C2)-methyltransferase